MEQFYNIHTADKKALQLQGDFSMTGFQQIT